MLSIEQNEYDKFLLSVDIPKWVSLEISLKILATAKGVVLGYQELKPGLKDLLEWVGVGRGSWEHGMGLGDIVVKVKLRLGDEKVELPPLRNCDHHPGIESRICDLFVRHIQQGVREWVQQHRDVRNDLLSRLRWTE